MKDNENLKSLVVLMKNVDLSYNEEGKQTFKSLATKVLSSLDKKLGFKTSSISFNPGGIAVSGEAHLTGIWNEEGDGIYIAISQGLHLPFMYRIITHMKDYKGGNNNWLSFYEMDNLDYIANKIKNLKGRK